MITSSVIIKDLGWNRIIQNDKNLNRCSIKVGLFGEVAIRGTINELGSPINNIPSRPFMTQAYEKYKRRLENSIDDNYRLVQNRVLTTNNYLKTIGEIHTTQIKNTITNGNFIPNAPSTIAKKGSSKPLIDTGEMRRSVTYKVIKG